MNEERVKVSDWSQPFKLGLMAIFAIGAGIWGLAVLNKLNEIIHWLQVIGK